MTVWLVLLTIVEIVTAFLLVLLVLLQRSKDEGLGMAFGNAMGESLFGAQAGNILTKATVVLGVIFLLNTVLMDRAISSGGRRGSGSLLDSVPESAAPAASPVETAPLMPADSAAIPNSEPAAAPLTLPAPAVSIPVETPVAPAPPAASTPAPAPAAPAPAPAP